MNSEVIDACENPPNWGGIVCDEVPAVHRCLIKEVLSKFNIRVNTDIGNLIGTAVRRLRNRLSVAW